MEKQTTKTGPWQRTMSVIRRFLTGGASDVTEQQKVCVQEMEKDYEDWMRKKRGAAHAKLVGNKTRAGESSC